MVATVSATHGAVACFRNWRRRYQSPEVLCRNHWPEVSSFCRLTLLTRRGLRYEAHRLGRWHRTLECHYLTQSHINSLSIRYRSTSKTFAGGPQREPLRLLCKCDDLAAHPAFRFEFHLGRTLQYNMRTADGQRHFSQKNTLFCSASFPATREPRFLGRIFTLFVKKVLT